MNRSRRIRLLGGGWILCACTVAYAIFANGEALLHNQTQTVWLIAVPVLIVLVSPLLMLGRSVGFVASMPILACVVIDIGFGLARTKKPSVERVLVAGHVLRTSDTVVGSGAAPDSWATIRRVVAGEPEFEVTYSIDSRGRRMTPVPEGGNPPRAALFLGGSWVYGTGVENDETFAAEFARLRPGNRSYNYGFHGYGPSHALDIVRGRDFRSEIPEDVDLAFYLLAKPDLKRVIGTMRVSAGYCRRCPNYEIGNSGALVRNGDFSNGRPLRTVVYSVLDRSNALRSLGIDLPLEFTDDHRRRTAAVIRAIRDELAAIYPAASFFVVLSPEDEAARAMAPFLESLDLAIMDFYDLYDLSDMRMRLSANNSHPSALAHHLIAKRLVSDLDAGHGLE